MVKSVLGVNHQGLRDWLAQRVTAVVMAVYLIGLVVFFVSHPYLTYYEWHELFGYFWMRVATVLVSLSLLYHAWVGMWTVYTDYIKCSRLRLVLNIVTILALIVFLLVTIQIVWGIGFI